MPPVSAATISSTDAEASTVASGGCIAVATSSCSASAFRKTRSSRSRSWSEPITSASVPSSPSRTTGELRDRVAVHHVDRLADLLVRRDRDERGRRLGLGALRAQQLGDRRRRARSRSRNPCSSIHLSSRNFERYERPESGSIASTCASGPEPRGDLDRRPDRRARRAAGEQALLAGEPARRQERVAVGDADPLVDHVGSIVSGQVSLPIPSTKYGWSSPSSFAV